MMLLLPLALAADPVPPGSPADVRPASPPVDAWSLPARAGDPVPLPERSVRVPRVTLNGPPVRVATGVRLRSRTQIGAHLELRVQPVRSRRFTVDLAVSGSPERMLDLLGPPRQVLSVDGLADLAWEPTPWLAVGPSGGLSYRAYRQQWTTVGDAWTPVAGGNLTAFVLRARRWGLAMRARGLADLGRTELVLETAAVEELVPFEATLAFELHLGHGRLRPATDEDAP